MSLARLRAAEQLIRDEWADGHEPMGTAWHQERDFHRAVADWLHIAAADLWAHGLASEKCLTCGGCDECDDLIYAPHIRAALHVSNVYLGPVSS